MSLTDCSLLDTMSAPTRLHATQETPSLPRTDDFHHVPLATLYARQEDTVCWCRQGRQGNIDLCDGCGEVSNSEVVDDRLSEVIECHPSHRRTVTRQAKRMRCS